MYSAHYKAIAFRLLYWPSRVLPQLLDIAIGPTAEAFDEYIWMDGDLVAGMALGHAFGDGYLSDNKLLEVLHRRCDFDYDEVKIIECDACPIHKPSYLPCAVYDGRRGLVWKGSADLSVAKLHRES